MLAVLKWPTRPIRGGMEATTLVSSRVRETDIRIGFIGLLFDPCARPSIDPEFQEDLVETGIRT